jgi:Cu(I)/Ag(I) efflux system membrane fusion protein
MRPTPICAGLTLATALLAGCPGTGSKPTKVELDGLELAASLSPAEGRVGANHITVELRNAAGEPVEDADVRVKVHMHAMGSMPAMGGPAGVKEMGGGEYRADFELDMGGSWIVEIDAKPPGGEPMRAEGSLTVGSEGLRLVAIPRAGAPGETERPDETTHPAEFSFDPARLQKSGVRTGRVERVELARSLRAVARVAWDETRLVDVSPRIGGWIEELRADAVGKRVERGEVLLTLYSPELYAGQQELLLALEARHASGDAAPAAHGDRILEAARRRLRLWGMAAADVERLERERRALEAVPLRAPVSGYVIEKDAVRGGAVSAGQRLLRIAPLDRVWLQADLYEAEVELVRVGQPARVTLAYRPGESYEGKVAYVYPFLEGSTRTLRVRVELDNPELALLPEMYADLELRVEPRTALAVPQDAVLYAGERRFVFLELGEGRFRPQRVEIGRRDGERVEVLAGLEEGQRIVTSGTFLIASESRLRAALEQW